tara:strand:- start:3128 stop:3712 length:585 start_codon:yes stop_codon:yes gene_type:complete
VEIILHRRNTLYDLKNTSKEFGIEIDIRSYKGQLILHHDPFIKGEYFSEWIKYYKHGTLILNVKEEGLENKILDILSINKINSFFFLDQSFPFIIKTLRNGEDRIALRVSEFESIETALNLKNKTQWIWVDMFSRFPLSKYEYKKLKEAKFKLCLVSPELQKLNHIKINKLKSYLEEENISLDAVCTKIPELWI